MSEKNWLKRNLITIVIAGAAGAAFAVGGIYIAGYLFGVRDEIKLWSDKYDLTLDDLEKEASEKTE